MPAPPELEGQRLANEGAQDLPAAGGHPEGGLGEPGLAASLLLAGGGGGAPVHQPQDEATDQGRPGHRLPDWSLEGVHEHGPGELLAVRGTP